jgi:hypothetical protein
LAQKAAAMEKPKNPPLARHSTNKGVFEIYARPLAGSYWCVLYLDSREIATGSFVAAIAETLARGGYDDLIGFETAALSIPSDYNQWNGGGLLTE